MCVSHNPLAKKKKNQSKSCCASSWTHHTRPARVSRMPEECSSCMRRRPCICWLVRRVPRRHRHGSGCNQNLRTDDADAAGSCLLAVRDEFCLCAGGAECVEPTAQRTARRGNLEPSVPALPLLWERLPASAARRGFDGFSTDFLGELCCMEELLPWTAQAIGSCLDFTVEQVVGLYHVGATRNQMCWH